MDVTLHLPYISLSEPMTVYYDLDLGLERIDYWGGLDMYAFSDGTGGRNVSHQIVPTSADGVSSSEQCFTMGTTPLVSVLPDASAWGRLEGSVEIEIEGSVVSCAAYAVSQPEYDPRSGLMGNYTYYVRADDEQTPVRLAFLGHNTITGGHVDEWRFDYANYAEAPQDESLFAAPYQGMTCLALETDDDDGGGPTKALRDLALQDLLKLHETAASSSSSGKYAVRRRRRRRRADVCVVFLSVWRASRRVSRRKKRGRVF